MRRVGAGCARFRRVHLTALLFDWRRTISSVVGVALGVTLVLGMVQLQREVTRPFDAFGPSLAGYAGDRAIQVTPTVAGRLPVAVVQRLRSEIPEAEAVVPFVAGMAPLEVGGTRHGFFVMGAPCTIELLVGPFDCEQRARTERPADGPGVPFEIPAVVADRLGLRLGDEVRIPGQPAGSAHLGWTFPEYDRVAGINGGHVLFAPDTDTAADLLGGSGFVTAAFVLPAPGADIAAEVDRIVADVATAGPPRPQVPVVYAGAKQSLNLTALSGILVGILIAVNTILLSIEERRSVMGTIGAIGATPRSLLAGFLGEGAVIGAIGGLLAVPSGYLLGDFLIDRFGRTMLDGSGAEIAVGWSPGLIGLGLGAGVLCGVLAMAGPAWRLVRDGPLAAMSSFGVVRGGRRIRLWVLILGVVTIAGAVALLERFQRGLVDLNLGSSGLFLGLAGVAAVTLWATPRIATGLTDVLARRRPRTGRLVAADIRRYATLFATTVAVMTVGTSLAVGSASVQRLAADQVAEQKAQRLSDTLVIAPQAILDQRRGRIAPATFELIERAAGGREIASRWTAMIPSATEPRIVVGVDPGGWYAEATVDTVTDARALWRGMSAGDVGLSEVAAGHLGVGVGDTVALPTSQGRKEFRVAGLFRPRVINDSTLGDIVLVSAATAERDWAAVRDQVIVRYDSAAAAAAHREDYLALGAGLSVYDDETWRTTGERAITRFFEPFTISGYVMMITAGISVLNVFVLALVQRRRERAVLRAIGSTVGTERAVVLAQAVLLAGLTIAFATAGGLGLIHLQATASPVFYGFQLAWGVVAGPLLVTAGAVLALVALASLYPVYRAGRLETVEVLRSE